MGDLGGYLRGWVSRWYVMVYMGQVLQVVGEEVMGGLYS